MNCKTCRYSGHGWHENECSRPTTECSYQPIEQPKPETKEVKKEVKKQDDAISRQAAIDAMCKLMNSWFGGDSKDEKEEIKWVINHLPSVQPEQPEIVCGDCKHWVCHDRRCGYWNHGVKPLMWCSQAERRWRDDER